MIGLLQLILCAIQQVAALVIAGIVAIINLLLVALGALAAAIVAILPAMPDPPAEPQSGVLNFINWVYPLGPMLGTLVICLTLWGLFLLVKMVLKKVGAV